MNNYLEIESLLDLSFDDKSLLKTSLTHSSYANENNVESNERLEFIGDAVLDLLIGEYFYTLDETSDEGVLTKIRAKNVCESALLDYSKACNLHNYILLGKGEEKTGGRERTAILADAFEAFIGAIYLDKGLDEVRKVIDKIVLPIVTNGHSLAFIDYKSKLQELVQSDKRSLKYEIVGESGPSHNKVFYARVLMDDIVMGEGRGKTKKESEQSAAKKALDKVAGNVK